MIVNEEAKTSPKQRIVICLIAMVLLGSTFALYASVVLNVKNGNGGTVTASGLTEEEQARFDELYAEYEGKVNNQAKEYSDKYFEQFKQYRSEVKAYNAADVNEVAWTDLVVGDGAEVTNTEFYDYAAYYIGFLSDETVFDSSFDDFSSPTKLVNPLNGTGNMIQGWLEGIVGMKIGGVRVISIPSVLGYGDQEQGSIPANSPLKFVIMLIPRVEEVEVPDELNNLWMKMYGVTS